MLVRLMRGALIGLDLFLAVTALIGGLIVIPTLPREWLTGSPFTDYTLPALALTMIGVAAAVAGVLVLARVGWGSVLSIAVGAAIAVFEIVETMFLGLDIWLHALGLGPAPASPVTGANLNGIPAPLGIPLPLWLQAAYFTVGIIIAGIALRLWSGRRRRSAGYGGQPAVAMS